MARRSTTYKVDDKKSRDHGREYLITEMDAEAAEWWAIRILLAIGKTEADIDFNAPLSQIYQEGFRALFQVEPAVAKPLLDEMMKCVRVKLPNSNDSRDLIPGDIEELKTRFMLRQQIIELLTGFSEAGEE